MNFTQFINKIDKLSVEQINTIYANTLLPSIIYTNTSLPVSPVFTNKPNIRAKQLIKTLENCQNEYVKDKIRLEDLNMINNDHVFSFIPLKFRNYIGYNETVKLQRKTKLCETLHDFCLKLCIDLSFN